ncbi:MAG: GTP-binding protein [Candidatus Vogelbacteria bacterium CG10_big_fil_rev_8_21_14_0_10_45_14]|uniref:GTP-binding protein n=1 Tax=Candidatus Vogelbacteria bacterium CG10_big_fil_rev_8_21_14_0_10_45_14 TaxID=1975042 RepID=A0A2H0RJD8_9BACT|nr:MAG: GTP-binding protein [Candidatus Vogelbacteria bacterium CG10_big_fil_rev_8_21_14_0_10_45_14]
MVNRICKSVLTNGTSGQIMIGLLAVIFSLALIILWGGGKTSPILYVTGATLPVAVAESEQRADILPRPTHIATPLAVKALYMTSWVAGTPSVREHVIGLLSNTEANSVVIDIKDDTGKISYILYDQGLRDIGAGEARIRDISALVERLHGMGVYVIGRVAVFQDPYMVSKRSDLAVKSAKDGSVWKDRKGLTWIDPGAREHWEYIAKIGEDAYENIGFDEINFDYIRFPTDGNMEDVVYSHYDSAKIAKAEEIEHFFAYLKDRMDGTGAIISADLFGMTTTNTDDLGIGQELERAFPYFHYISPMVYPSHYPPTWNGFKNPADHPYEVIKIAMDSAVSRAKEAGVNPHKLRPWLQDFNLGATYDATKVRAQIQATYDAGLTSWLLWDPKNRYTQSALHPN